ncbi:MAG TPA: 4'-phosphopantetheinyl transferase superfamily protein [Stellaceae bacterium]|jgi:enterobactin synthetase component D|nr:4'-phosphopantetheinyl transferase superfamily protein [Stellaceae bacterium]
MPALPALFPSFVCYRGVAVTEDDFAGAGTEIPPALAAAIPRRRAEFVAGRLCARAALNALGAVSTEIPRAADGSPEWPAGFVGSISHTSGLAFAAACRAADAQSLGLDVERLVAPDLARQLATIVATPAERARFDLAGAEFSIIFSAKEAVYKCLYPLVREFLEFTDVEIEAIGADRFTCRLTRALSAAFPAGTAIEGRYTILDGMIHAGVVLR